MCTSTSAAVWLGSILSVLVGVWALSSMATPFGIVAGTGAALFGLAFGVVALRADAGGRWRKTAIIGIATSTLAIVVAATEVVYAVFVE